MEPLKKFWSRESQEDDLISYQKENDELLKSFLGRTFFKGWANKKDPRYLNFQRLEIYLNTKCNLACKYCYLARFGGELYPANLEDRKAIYRNMEIFFDWLIERDLVPDIDFFGGEPLIQQIGFDVLELILDKFHLAKRKPRFVVIPTNYTFLLNEKLIQKVEDLITKGKRYGISISLSASFDGKLCESNRPFKRGQERRGDRYYDRVFEFSKKHCFGFHPMVYSELIEEWPENFLWFQRNFRKFGIPFDNIYLLEVRNVEWSVEQLRNYMKFIKFLIRWTYEGPCELDVNKYYNFIFHRRGYNILTNCLSTIGRGIGCSLQSCLYLRAGDLAIVPCHRQSYTSNILGKFIIEGKKIVDIRAMNPELFIGEVSFDSKAQPQCEQCSIKFLCQGQCLGSMYEVTGDMFSPIPSVCRLIHAKLIAMIDTYKELGIYEAILGHLNSEKQESLKILEELRDENKQKRGKRQREKGGLQGE